MFIPWHRKNLHRTVTQTTRRQGLLVGLQNPGLHAESPKVRILAEYCRGEMCSTKKRQAKKNFFEGIALTSIFTGCGLGLACRHVERVDGSRLPICGRLGSRDIGTPEPISVCPALYQSTCEKPSFSAPSVSYHVTWHVDAGATFIFQASA